ncbi:MAG TPA: polysaccharide pyruvyl transferase family protein [Sedimentisphaerales bacterium]|nr:polysaccharide pyruvyl transferase family protein [Sedimentisphaerales bacterium]
MLILHGNNHDSNRGCQALRWCTQTILDRYAPDLPRLHANIFYNDHPHFQSRQVDRNSPGQLWEVSRRGRPGFYLWGARVVCSRMLARLPKMKVHEVQDGAAAVLALGGDNLSYDYGFLATLLFFSPLQAALRQRIPTVVWAASVGPFSSRPHWERRFADLLRRVDLITVREPLTQAYLEELGIRDNVRRTADPAFLLPARPTQLPRRIEEALEAGAIGINLASLMVRYSRLSTAAWLAEATRMVAEVRRGTTAPILLIPHVMMPPHVFPANDDYAFLSALAERLPADVRKGVCLYDARDDDCRQIKWVISRLRVYVGARFHSMIAALSSGVPTFCIGYGVKTRGINLELFGHEQWVCSASQLTAGRLVERLQVLLEAQAEVRSHLRSVIPACVENAWKNGEFLAGMLKDRQGSGRGLA